MSSVSGEGGFWCNTLYILQAVLLLTSLGENMHHTLSVWISIYMNLQTIHSYQTYNPPMGVTEALNH